MARREHSKLGPVRSLVARIGEVVIYGLIRLFGRRVALVHHSPATWRHWGRLATIWA
jgi:hypothetical protein